MKERRKRKRKSILEKATAELLDGHELSSGQQLQFSFTQDVSLTGIKIITDRLLPIDTLLGIKFLITETKNTVNLKGKVKWATKYHDKDLYETGLEFVDTSLENILALMEYIYKKEENSRP